MVVLKWLDFDIGFNGTLIVISFGSTFLFAGVRISLLFFISSKYTFYGLFSSPTFLLLAGFIVTGLYLFKTCLVFILSFSTISSFSFLSSAVIFSLLNAFLLSSEFLLRIFCIFTGPSLYE